MCVIDKTGTACLVYLMLIRCQVEVEEVDDVNAVSPTVALMRTTLPVDTPKVLKGMPASMQYPFLES